MTFVTSGKTFSQEEFKKIYSEVPRLCVIPFVKTSEGVLLTLRNIEPCIGMWHFAGGTVLMNETLEEALRRIAKEELGVDIKINDLLDTIEYLHSKSVHGHSVALVYSVEALGEIKINQEASDFGLFKSAPVNTIPEESEFFAKMW